MPDVNIFSLAASHHDLGLDELEELSAASGALGETLLADPALAEGVVVLATCNRFEVYVHAPESASPAEVADLVARRVASATGLTPEGVRAALTARTGADAARHLLEVASGLDSMVVGEREIAGQVRRALGSARARGTASSELERLFGHASRVSRRVESATGLGAVGRSIVGVGLDLAGEHLGPWRLTRAVLIGTGSYAGASLAALRARGCHDVRVFSRSGRAPAFARARGVAAIEEGGLVDALTDADLVVSCSGRIGTVLDAAAVRTARERATEQAEQLAHEPDPSVRPLVVLDLALQRDVEAEVADVDGVLLFDLANVRAHAPAAGAEPVRRAHEIVDAAVAELDDLAFARRVDLAALPRIRAAQADAAVRLDDERAALAARGVSGAEERRAERAARRAVAAERHARIMAAKQACRDALTLGA